MTPSYSNAIALLRIGAGAVAMLVLHPLAASAQEHADDPVSRPVPGATTAEDLPRKAK